MKEFLTGFRRKETNAPVMKKKGDVYLFGTTHDVEIGNKKLFTYAKRVSSSDHLLLEGTKAHYGAQYAADYENTAYALFQTHKKESVHFLEEGYDSNTKLEEYGVNGKDIVVYRSYSALLHELQAQHDGRPVDLVKDIQEISDSLRTEHPSLSQYNDLDITVGTAYCSMRKLLQTSDPITPYVPKGKVLLQLYNASVRDYEVLGPRVSDLTENLSGKKSLFVGSYHLPNMEKAVQGETIAKPLPWDEHIKRLSEEDQKAVNAFQNVARGKI